MKGKEREGEGESQGHLQVQERPGRHLRPRLPSSAATRADGSRSNEEAGSLATMSTMVRVGRRVQRPELPTQVLRGWWVSTLLLAAFER